MLCPKCKQDMDSTASFCPHCGTVVRGPETGSETSIPSEQRQASLQTFQLVMGICSIVLSLFISFQSFAMGPSNLMSNNGSVSGSIGVFVSFVWLVAGILCIAGRKHIAPSYVAGGFYLSAAALSQVDIGYFGDLQVWGVLSLLFGAICFCSGLFRKGEKPNVTSIKARRIPMCLCVVFVLLTIILMLAS